MKSKTILFIISLSFIVYFLWPRSTHKMSSIAKEELVAIVPQPLINQLSGPLIRETDDHSEFVWFKNLEWGDTSKIYIRVYKNFYSCKEKSWWRSFLCYLEPQVTMNYEWNYFIFEDGTGNFLEAFPSGGKAIEVQSSLISNADSIRNGYELIVPSEQIVKFLENGYFEVLQKENDTTIISFYEPIANWYLNNRKDTIWVSTAKVISNDTTGITLVPYKISDLKYYLP